MKEDVGLGRYYWKHRRGVFRARQAYLRLPPVQSATVTGHPDCRIAWFAVGAVWQPNACPDCRQPGVAAAPYNVRPRSGGGSRRPCRHRRRLVS